jgi:hypothetical protein
MEYEITVKESPGWGKVAVLGATYEPGKPEDKDRGKWRQKLESRQEKLRYLRSGERYWYSNEEWFGSEMRKNPA